QFRHPFLYDGVRFIRVRYVRSSYPIETYDFLFAVNRLTLVRIPCVFLFHVYHVVQVPEIN
ncbi:Hypothetical predicted protein, partial [Mytilus galloprovincialis]